MKALLADHQVDPKKEIWDRVQPYLGQIEVIGARLLIAIYQRPEKTKGGIIITQKTQGEDVWQGKVGLVLKMGPLAFTSDEKATFLPPLPLIGDWVAVRVGDTWQAIIGEQHVRMVEDVDVRLILQQPDIIF